METLDASDADSDIASKYAVDSESETESDREFEAHLNQIMGQKTTADVTADPSITEFKTSSLEESFYNINSIITGLGLLAVSINRTTVRRDKSEKYSKYAAATAHYEWLDANHIRDKLIEWELDRRPIPDADTESVCVDWSETDRADPVAAFESVNEAEEPRESSGSRHRLHFLMDRFVRANQIRRQFLEYERAHLQKVCAQEPSGLAYDMTITPDTCAPDAAPQSHIAGPVPSQTTISEVGADMQDVILAKLMVINEDETIDCASERSWTLSSCATSVTSKRLATLSVPKPPSECRDADGTPFKNPFRCPYCQRMIIIRTKKHWW